GNGIKPGTYPKTCSACLGRCQINTTMKTPFGMFTSISPCAVCKARGYIIEFPCDNCIGSGIVQRNKKLIVKIPP
ncbi:MAG TPA: molecular chaperone DnaJ, partial [Elusimicrobia bacterium]|nr:molecular chaperone DnaJ [Elusimicrobiota bacterium]